MECFDFKIKHNGAYLKRARLDGSGLVLYHRPNVNDFSVMAPLK